MNEPAHNEITEAPLAPSADFDELIAALRAAGVARFDPVRLHYVEVLARRASAQPESVRPVLDARVAQALTALKQRFEHARRDAAETLAEGIRHYPQAASDLQRHFDAGDFKGLRRLLATLKAREQSASLGELVRQLEHQPAGNAGAHLQGDGGSRAELKTLRQFRNTWSKLSVGRQVAQALEQAPKNAGPINSHMLVLRSLAMMRDISPDYLNRFISYADALLSLDQAENDKPGNAKKPQAARAARK